MAKTRDFPSHWWVKKTLNLAIFVFPNSTYKDNAISDDAAGLFSKRSIHRAKTYSLRSYSLYLKYAMLLHLDRETENLQ